LISIHLTNASTFAPLGQTRKRNPVSLPFESRTTGTGFCRRNQAVKIKKEEMGSQNANDE